MTVAEALLQRNWMLIMSNAQQYSSLFTTIYDQASSLTNSAYSTHYSILRAIEWFDVERKPLIEGQIHDFAVIWDSDHDTRVIKAIEKIYVAGLLSPVQFIGEHKGELTIILAAKHRFGYDDFDSYVKKVSAIAANLDFDSWTTRFGMFDRGGPEHQCDFEEIIADSHDNTFVYLRSIDLQWRLGTYSFAEKIR